LELPLEQVAEGYRAMDERRARKRAALALMKGMDADFSMMISFMKNLADVSQQAIWAFLGERSFTRERREGMSDRQDERRPETPLQARREGPTGGKKVWLITGAGRGMGVDIAKAALAAGNAVVATGRNIDVTSSAVGQAENLLIVKLDVTSSADAETAVKAVVDRFGHIDVLVNNAANFYGGYFEELTPEQIERQLATGLIGPMNVTRAVLPVMRKQRSGHIISISSGAGLVGFEFNSAYAAAKFGMEGWMESLAPEVAPFGISTTIVNPGFFRTELLTQASAIYAEPSIVDYADRHAERVQWYEAMNGQQGGDPARLGQALVTIASQQPPPRRFIAGADAIAIAEQKVKDLQEQINAYRDLSISLAHDEVKEAQEPK
jgi:NAD(P)-dependent dehydrogenase (short-subunit alcohol dehydrogenase family)